MGCVDTPRMMRMKPLFRPMLDHHDLGISLVRMSPPETVSQLRSFLGMMNFFASHIAVFSERASPDSSLTDLLRGATTGRQRLLWTPSCDQAFRDLKSTLISTPVLRGFDPLLRTVV